MPDIGTTAVAGTPALTDRFGRTITYLRLAITDRCNLRCTYCMPPEGVLPLHHSDILTFEEMQRLVALLCRMGVNKVRLTGGEPFVRKGLVPFMQRLGAIPHLRHLHITSNGVRTASFIPQLEAMRLAGLNLSLDTLDPEKFSRITRRGRFAEVQKSLHALLESSIPLKINTVVKFGLNDDEIGDIASLARRHPVQVRFIEEMPFNGEKTIDFISTNYWIEQRLKSIFPTIKKDGLAGTAQLYTVPGFSGKIGVISGAERTFCGSCNRLRMTADGRLKTCLYDDGILDLRALLRSGASDAQIGADVRTAVHRRVANGHVAEQAHRKAKSSMSQIGG